ncbi:dodecin [Aestuariibaculum sediminum]|uniref:Dodecin domain-containing protein n=1 Tax=Aestuariibaculum sediminum TaxID=2770637 RepID=A0A8J6Q3U0_9FLAO|nr:dodecin [Aestuariibaculum sediminum]MBD0832705.1 dodecin domain-containing protein [Aestuariibaculum sediminum]
MDAHIYKIIEIVGTSNQSSDDAIQNALEKASKSIHNLRWFEVVETRGNIEDGQVAIWQVTLKVGFTMNA